MTTYLDVIETLGTSRLLACAVGEAGVPLVNYRAPAEWYGFPPALIPIWSDGSGPNYLGIWKHWFSSRSPSFVKQFVGLGHLTVEIARTEEQFFAYIAIHSITSEDGIGAPLLRFADVLGLSNLEEIDLVTVESGDDPRRYASLSTFAVNVPLESCAPEVYDGTFPIDATSADHASSFELKEDNVATIQRLPERFLAGSNKPRMFEEYLASERFEAAWLTLNSSGWMYRNAAKCAKALAEQSGDKEFSRFIEVWIRHAETQAGGY